MAENKIYQKKRAYRYQNDNRSFCLRLMEQRFAFPFENAWEQFGYEIGGPVCYSFVRWIAERLAYDPEVTGLAFVARDGYLLRECFQMLPVCKEIQSHYVFASRAVAASCEDAEGRTSFHKHLDPMDFGDGTVGVVDTVTMKFTSQKLMQTELRRKTKGYFWTVLRSAENYGEGLDYRSFQTEDYHLIRCWNLIEFIVTSPEPPIERLVNGMPVYRDCEWETERKRLFEKIEKGVLEFMEAVCAEGSFPFINSREITAWVNEYLKYPSQEDLEMFTSVRVAEDADHREYIPLDPFFKKAPLKAVKDELWFFSQRHSVLYGMLHGINLCRKRKEKRS